VLATDEAARKKFWPDDLGFAVAGVLSLVLMLA
jgi:hypothetical protein